MAFPLAVIDFEASALHPQSYPIEAGFAIMREIGGQIETWSGLIQPAASWLEKRGWDPDAQRVHGIRPFDLCEGATPREMAEVLNRVLGPIGIVWCDGGHYDALWLNILFEKADLTPAFTLKDISELEPDATFDQATFRAALAKSSAPHRAGPDVLRLIGAMHSAWSFGRDRS